MLPSSLQGVNNIDVRKRDGLDGIAAHGGIWGFIVNKVPESGGGSSSKEEAALSKEAEGGCRQVTSYYVGGGNRDDDSGSGQAAPHVLDLWCLGCRPASQDHELFPGLPDDSASGDAPSID